VRINNKAWWVFVFKPLLKYAFSFTLIFGGLFLLLSQVFLPLFLNSAETKTVTPLQQFVLGILTENTASPLKDVTSLVSQPALNRQTANLNIENLSSVDIPSEFYLSIPSLDIEKAVVETNSINPSPDFRLGHFRGSSLPGELGASFIYGHSSLPYFFSPTNYKTIFSTLPNLKAGDVFFIHYNNLSFKYQVESTKVMEPYEVDPLKDYGLEINSSSSAVLMTCYPPGLSSKRFIAIGRLIF